MKKGRKAALGAAGLLGWILSWWLFAVIARLRQSPLAPLLSDPWSVGLRLLALAMSPSTWLDVAATVAVALSGLAVACALGIPVGVAMGRYGMFTALLRPLVDTFRALPSAAVIPVAILLLRDHGLRKTLFVVALGATWPVLVNARDGVRNLPSQFNDTLQLLKLPEKLAIRLCARRALPAIISGVRISISIALILTITVEMFAPGSLQSGLGHLILTFQEAGDVTGMYAGIVLLMLLGLSLNSAAEVPSVVSWLIEAHPPIAAAPPPPEHATSYLPVELRDLPETTLRLLTADKVTETIEEIYGRDGARFALLDLLDRGDTIERWIEFRASRGGALIILGHAQVFRGALRRELAVLGHDPDPVLADVLREHSIGRILRNSLNDYARYIDDGLTVLPDGVTQQPTGARRYAPAANGPLVLRQRHVRGAKTGELLVAIEECVPLPACSRPGSG